MFYKRICPRIFLIRVNFFHIRTPVYEVLSNSVPVELEMTKI